MKKIKRLKVQARCQICGSRKADKCGGCSTEEHRVFVCEKCQSEHICLEVRPGEHRRNP